MTPTPHSEFTRPASGAALAACVGMLIGPAVIVLSTLGLFMVPLQHQLGLTRAQISAIEIITPAMNGITSLFAGRWMDRWGVRRVLLPAVLAFVVIEALQARIQTTWELILLFAVLGIDNSINSAIPYTKIASEWFARRRGLVIGIIMACNAIGSAIIPQLVRRWMDWYGWRGASLGLALMVLLIGVPVLFLLLRQPPVPLKAHAPSGAERARLDAQGRHAIRADALRRLDFWLIVGVVVFTTTAEVGTVAHAVPMMTERGFSRTVATNAMSMLFFGGLVGQLASGLFADRFNTPKIVLPFFIAPFLGILPMYLAASPFWLFGGAALVGLGQGSELGISAYLVSRYFGLPAFGQLYGLVYAGVMTGVCIGILGTGLLHDAFGGYHPVGYINAGLLGMSVLLLALLRPYPALALQTRAAEPTPP
jgi:MFS family permease